MNSILNESYLEKWKSSDTYNRINSELLKNTVFINENILEDFFENNNFKEFYISKYLFTNKDLVDILNSINIRSVKEESYEIINEYNKAIPVKWDELKKEYYIKDGYENHPVVGISWQGAKFISGLFGGRLPFESEWIISAKSGNKDYLYTWGNDEPRKELANYEENVGETTIVGTYPPNDLGIYDMAGNVEEWCEDAPELENGEKSKYERIVKGGCWYKPSDNLLVDSKRTRWAKMGATGIGFRVVWDK